MIGMGGSSGWSAAATRQPELNLDNLLVAAGQSVCAATQTHVATQDLNNATWSRASEPIHRLRHLAPSMRLPQYEWQAKGE